MRTSFTVTILVLAVLLGSLAVVHTGGKYKEKIFGSPAIAAGEKLLNIKELDKTRSIQISDTNGNKFQIKQTGNFWSITEPWEDRANPSYIRVLFQFIASLEVQDVIERDNLNLDDFHLKKGQIRVKMFDENNATVCDLKIGRLTAWKIPSEDKTPQKGAPTYEPTIFIRLSDEHKRDKIYICTSNTTAGIHSLFANNFAQFRDHRPLYFSHRYLDKVSIKNQETEIVVSRPNLNAAWKITKPNQLRVDPEATALLFNSLAKLTALKVEDRSSVTLPTAADNVNQSQEVSIHFAGQPEDVTLRIYPPTRENANAVLATVSDRPNTVFHLPLTQSAVAPESTSLNSLQVGVNDLRSKTMTQLNGKELQAIIIRPGGLDPILLKRERLTEWQMLRTEGWRPTNTDTLIRLIQAVTQDKIVKFVTDAATSDDLTAYGLDRPFLLLGFNNFNNKGLRIAIGRSPKDGKSYARILGKPNIWEISTDTLQKIALYSWQWRTPHVWHIPEVDIQKIVLERKGKPSIELSYQYFADKWSAKIDGQDATSSLNPNRAKFFLKQLTSIKAHRWLGPRHTDAIQAIQAPDTVIKIHVTQVNNEGIEIEPVIKTLRIAHTPGGLIYFAKVDTLPVGQNKELKSSYFFLSPKTIPKLYVDLFD